jgi:two-component system, NtrC family, response regulator AtoC
MASNILVSDSFPNGVLVMSAEAQLESSQGPFKVGAYTFPSKALSGEAPVVLKNTTAPLRPADQLAATRVQPRPGNHEIIAEAKKMQEVMVFVQKVAASEASTILIQGESGTGKDLIAKWIHYESSRQEKQFVAVNCSAIPETLMEAELFGHERGAFTDAKAMKKGLFEVADGGTLFLDEIGELSPLLQAKLLRVLEDQVIRRVGGVRDMQVDVRVIAASNRDLERAVREGTFRQDLYYRLAIISIFLPPLRERRDDILPMVEFFIDRYNRKFRKTVRGITEDTRRLLMTHNWPGNVRELKNAIERAMILEEEEFLRPTYMPFAVGKGQVGLTAFEHVSGSPANTQQLEGGRSLPPLAIPEGGTSLEEVERAFVELAMRQSNNNQTQAAKLLDITRDTLRYKLKKYGLVQTDSNVA